MSAWAVRGPRVGRSAREASARVSAGMDAPTHAGEGGRARLGPDTGHERADPLEIQGVGAFRSAARLRRPTAAPARPRAARGPRPAAPARPRAARGARPGCGPAPPPTEL